MEIVLIAYPLAEFTLKKRKLRGNIWQTSSAREAAN